VAELTFTVKARHRLVKILVEVMIIWLGRVGAKHINDLILEKNIFRDYESWLLPFLRLKKTTAILYIIVNVWIYC